MDGTTESQNGVVSKGNDLNPATTEDKSNIIYAAGESIKSFSGYAKECSIYLWTMNDCQLYHEFKGHTGTINSLESYQFSRGENKLVSVSNDKHMNFWDVQNKQLIQKINSERSLSLLQIFEGAILTGSHGGEITVWSQDANGDNSSSLFSSSSSSLFSSNGDSSSFLDNCSLETQLP